jgi:hypothetical protein
MDSKNRFHTPDTWLLVRAEYIALMAALIVLVGLHLSEVDWVRFALAFIALDLVGYFPGTIAYRRAGGGRIAPLYHRLYNVTHSFLTVGVFTGVWALLLGHFEWAMLAMPIHLAGDRGLFGNTYKPVGLPFEPAEVTDSKPRGASATLAGQPTEVCALRGSPDLAADHPRGSQRLAPRLEPGQPATPPVSAPALGG